MPRSSASSRVLTDTDEIRQWAEERGAKPACVIGTGGNEDVGMIRLDFPGYSGEGSLEEISWDDWAQKFEDSNLALLVQNETADGERSNFNKLVSRHSGEGSRKSRGRGSAPTRRSSAQSKSRRASKKSTRSRARTTRSENSGSRRQNSKRNSAQSGGRSGAKKKSVGRASSRTDSGKGRAKKTPVRATGSRRSAASSTNRRSSKRAA